MNAPTDTPVTENPVTETLLCRDAVDTACHHAIRRAVFVVEQGLFTGTDRDAHDDDPACLHVIGMVDGTPGGTVRLYPLEMPGKWQGDRLAVLPEYRQAGLGAPLVRFAVASAAALGGRLMVANVQAQNLTFFRRLGWRQRTEPRPYRGMPHVVVDIGLGAPGALTASAPR